MLKLSNESQSDKVRNVGKSKEMKEFEGQFSQFFDPKVDIERSLRNKHIVFERPKGPKENADGTLISRSIIGTQQMMDEALFQMEERVRLKQMEKIEEQMKKQQMMQASFKNIQEIKEAEKNVKNKKKQIQKLDSTISVG